MRHLIFSALLLNACALSPLPRPQGCSDVINACDKLIQAEEERYEACEARTGQCLKKLEATSPPLFTKIVWGAVGLLVGIVLGAKATGK